MLRRSFFSSLHHHHVHWSTHQMLTSPRIASRMFSHKPHPMLYAKHQGFWHHFSYPLVMTNIAIEHGPVEIVDFPMKNGGSFHSFSLNYQEGKSTQPSSIIQHHPAMPAASCYARRSKTQRIRSPVIGWTIV